MVMVRVRFSGRVTVVSSNHLRILESKGTGDAVQCFGDQTATYTPTQQVAIALTLTLKYWKFYPNPARNP